MAFKEDAQYDAVVTAAGLTASQSGNTGIDLRFKTDEGPAQATLWLTEKNKDHVHRTLEALGVQNPASFDIDQDLDKLEGQPCLLTFAQEEYNGAVRMRVRWVNAYRQRVTAEQVEAARRFFGKGTAKPIAPLPPSPGRASASLDFSTKGKPVAPISAPKPVDQRITDEDVPF